MVTLQSPLPVRDDPEPDPERDPLQLALDLVSQLETALEHRTIISAAIGMLMERYSLDYDRAFSALSRESQNRNVKIYELAKELVATGSTGSL